MYCSKCSLRNPIQSLIFWNVIFNDIQILSLGVLCIEKLRLLLELTLLEICAQNQGNSVSGDLKGKNFLGSMPPDPPDPPRRDRLWRSIITIHLLRNFCQLIEKLWTTLWGSCPDTETLTLSASQTHTVGGSTSPWLWSVCTTSQPGAKGGTVWVFGWGWAVGTLNKKPYSMP